MRVSRLCSLLFLPLMMSGCVSLSKYNARVEQIRQLNGEMASLERTLRQSESARSGLDSQLQKARENLVKLQEEHEALKTQAFAGSATGGVDRSAMEGERQQFSQEIVELTAQLAEANAKIKELVAALAAKEEAVKKVPTLEAALAEREERINALTGYLRSRETEVAKMKLETVALSVQRNGTEEKERAVSAIRTLLDDEIARGEIIVREYPNKLIVSMKDQVLFDSGSARITKSGQRTLNRMARILRKIRNNQILVEGHTDANPIGQKLSGKYPTNWDLAAARAVNVLKHLEKKGKVDPKLLALAGYGCYLPAAADSARNRKFNRRTEIAIIPLELERLAALKQKTAMK